MNLGNGIKTMRKEAGITQAELAEQIGSSQTVISAIESGARPQPNTLSKISKALGIPESLFYIAGLEKEDFPEENHQLYDQLFPVILELISKLIKKQPHAEDQKR